VDAVVVDKLIAHVINAELAILNYNLYIIINRKSMKPLNLDNSPCTPTSSNCVIWQGPNIPCIKLCKGDTVSDVVFALATELCTVLDTLNVNNYDLSCFNSVACPPANFQALIQYLINQICEAQGIVVTEKVASSGCPDCVVTVASCFIEGNQTTMQLVDYVNMIANKICGLILQISDLQNQISDLDIRVTVLENAPAPTFTLPSILVDCTLQDEPFIGFGSAATQIDILLGALINDDTYGYCALRSATGLPADILTAVESQCITSGTDSLLYGTPMGTAYSETWVDTPETVADAITNLWITLCDVFSYLSGSLLSVVDTNTVNLTYTSNVLTAAVQDTGWVKLEGLTYYTDVSLKPECRRIGNVLHFRGTLIVPLADPVTPTSVVNLSAVDAYYGVAGCETFGGTGGCAISANGNITFNNGTSVIPTSVLPSGVSLDGTYSTGFVIGQRPININASNGTALTSVFNIVLNSTKTLTLGLLKDLEIIQGRTLTQGNSPLRLITSNVRSGQYLPDYLAAGTDIHNAPSNANFPLVSDTFNLTWPFSCDAGDENQVGGFGVRLDGLIAYINPCETLIPTPTPCVVV
jgi:hypothetical protein